MYLQELSLATYRNISSVALTFRPGVTVFVGPNGQGKTNLVEAIEYAATQRSHRVTSDQALVMTGHGGARIRAVFRAAHRRSQVDIQVRAAGSNQVLLNENAVQRKSLVGQFPLVFFSPSDLSLVRGDPSERRRYLDELVLKLRPSSFMIFHEYERIVRQRNALLRHLSRVGGRTTDALHDWDVQLVDAGSQILHFRQQVLTSLVPDVAASYEAVARRDQNIELDLAATVPVQGDLAETKAAFWRILDENRAREVERGSTLYGPHRDDLVLTVDGLVVRQHASHGESWSFALALRLGEAEALRRRSRVGDPILILDDVFAELDRARRTALAERVIGFEQVFITAAVPQELPEIQDERRISVHAGECEEETHG